MEWWLRSDAGLMTRVALGAAFFAGMAGWELWKQGCEARRWREYLFLVVCALAAMGYGVVNDLLTSRISWEYFYYGKGLDLALGMRIPPDPNRLAWEAAKVGMKATWTAGLIIGVGLLLGNNPGKRGWPRLTHRRLAGLLPMILAFTLAGAAVGGAVGYSGGLTWVSGDFADLVRQDLWRPGRFMEVFGIHLGGYVGGAVGMAWGIWRIRSWRKAMAAREVSLVHSQPPPGS